MKKIYLAVSDKEDGEIRSTIKGLLPFVDVHKLSSKEEVLEAISNPFLACITLSDFLDQHILESIKLEGQLIVIDYDKSINVTNKNIVLCRSTNDTRMAIYDSPIGHLGIDRTVMEPSNDKPIKKEIANETAENDVKKSDNQEKAIDKSPPEFSKEKDNTNSKIPPKENDLEKNSEKINSKSLSKTPSPESKKAAPNQEHDNSSASQKKRKKIYISSPTKAHDFGRKLNGVNLSTEKTVGIWAPLTAGATTFIVDYAIFLQQHGVPISVVEIPKENPHLFKILHRFGSKPDNWISLTENLYSNDNGNNNSLWIYKGVKWFPVGLNDFDIDRNQDLILDFFISVKENAYVLVDLPTGKMDDSTLNTLPYLDEIWVIADDQFDRTKEWKNFIHNTLIKEYKKPVKLIHSRTGTHSRPKDVAELLDLELITSLPSMFDRVMANNHERKPLIADIIAAQKLIPPFIKIARGFVGKEFDKIYRPTFWMKIKRKLLDAVD